MKTTTSNTLMALATSAILLSGLNACKSKQKAKKQDIQTNTGSTEIVLPFSGKDYRSDEEHFRARNSGHSTDMATAKKIAMTNAKSEIASNIQTTLKKVTDQYTNQRTVGNKLDFENKFEELVREVTNQELTDVRLLDEKLFKESDGTYTHWVAIEIPKKSLLEHIDKSIGNNEKLKLDYDKMKFQQIFDEEMKKLAKEQQGK